MTEWLSNLKNAIANGDAEAPAVLVMGDNVMSQGLQITTRTYRDGRFELVASLSSDASQETRLEMATSLERHAAELRKHVTVRSATI